MLHYQCFLTDSVLCTVMYFHVHTSVYVDLLYSGMVPCSIEQRSSFLSVFSSSTLLEAFGQPEYSIAIEHKVGAAEDCYTKHDHRSRNVISVQREIYAGCYS